MTERKRVLYSLLLLALFTVQLVYVCTAFAFDQSEKYSTSISLEEETEEDVPSPTSEEDSETEADYFLSQTEILLFLHVEETASPLFYNNLPSLFVHLDTPFSPPELVM